MTGSKVMTVLGAVDPGELGVTLCHEHLISDCSCWWVDPNGNPELDSYRDAPIELSTLSLARWNSCSAFREHLVLDELETVIEEVGHYVRRGGRSIVDVTTDGFGRDPLGLARISRAAGVHIVMATGWYVELSHPSFVREASIGDLEQIMLHEIAHGASDTQVRPGIIKVGAAGLEKETDRDVGDITAQEEKVFRAGCRVARATGLPLTIHTRNRASAAFTNLSIAKDEGLDLDHFSLCHTSSILDSDTHLQLLEAGAIIQFDNLGMDLANHGYTSAGDWIKLQWLKRIINAGFGHRVMISHDIWSKLIWRKYGGNGYDHILRNLIPRLQADGVGEEAVRALLIENPARFLTVKCPVVANASTAATSCHVENQK